MKQIPERGQALVNAPGSVTPQYTLTTVREINAAIRRNLNGGNYGVYCNYETKSHQVEKARITRAKTEQGVHKVRLLNSGTWVAPLRVYTEG